MLRLLGLERGGPTEWTGDDYFELDVADGPNRDGGPASAAFVDRGYSGRISAGYCWEVEQAQGRLSVPGREDRRLGNDPGTIRRTPAWGRRPAGRSGLPNPLCFNQVGCIYTAQGFEYDYSGVILGPDLVWRTDHWEARPERSRDNQVRRAELGAFDRAIRNTYKVLLTRGMRGTLVVSTDAETQELLRTLIG